MNGIADTLTALYAFMILYLIGVAKGISNPRYGLHGMKGKTSRELWHYALHDPWYYLVVLSFLGMMGCLCYLLVAGQGMET